MSDLQLPLQAAIKTALAGLTVYDHVPQDAVVRFCVIGDDLVQEAGSKTHDGQEVSVMVHFWDRKHRGNANVKADMATAYTALHNQSLSLSSGALINLRFENSQILDDPDGVTSHGWQRYRAYVTG